MTEDARRNNELQHVARLAAQAAAEQVNAAAMTAHQVTAAAAAAAKGVAEATRVDVRHMQEALEEIKEKLDSKYVTVEAFAPVKTLVFGLVGLILVAVVGALVALVLR
jgi:hypothetical protein